MTDRKDNRSPLTDKPLRLPGQALQEERRRLWEEKIEPPMLVALFFAMIALLEWYRSWKALPPMPWLLTLAAASVVLFAAWRFFKYRPRMRALRLGMEGERVVGQYLEGLRSEGYRVFHDVPAQGFNLDHVCIGPAGVFTVETKTWTKPARVPALIEYDGQRLLLAGREPDRDVLAQASGQARWIHRLLEESTGRSFAVQPVVVFPGWFVKAAAGAQKAVWVMEPKGLPAFLARAPNRMAPEDVKLAAFHLSRYIRVQEQGA
jgi:Nuclease-related domain